MLLFNFGWILLNRVHDVLKWYVFTQIIIVNCVFEITFTATEIVECDQQQKLSQKKRNKLPEYDQG